MMAPKTRCRGYTRGYRPYLRAQRGVVLFIAMIALVAIMMAALGLVRSVETANLVAGNIALKQGALSEAERIMNEAFSCLDRGGKLLDPGIKLSENQDVCNYYASLLPSDAKRPYGVPDMLKDNPPVYKTSDATGNAASFVIERMCTKAGAWTAANCMESPFGKSARYTDRGEGGLAPPQALYRITVKVAGPRGVTAYSQMILNASY